MAEIASLFGDHSQRYYTNQIQLPHLNRSLRSISSEARCIGQPVFWHAREGQFMYGLPDEFIRADIVKFYIVDRYRDLNPGTLQTNLFLTEYNYSTYPAIFDIWGKANIEKIESEEVVWVGASQIGIPSALGHSNILVNDELLNISDSSNTQIINNSTSRIRDLLDYDGNHNKLAIIEHTNLTGGTRSQFRVGDAFLITGTGENLGETRSTGASVIWVADNLIAVEVTGETNDIVVNDAISNLTDTSTGSVTYVTTLDPSGYLTILTYNVLLGGTRQRFKAGDLLRVRSPHAQNHNLIISPTPQEDDEQGFESIAAWVIRQHRHITLADIDNNNDELELDTELEEALVELQCKWITRAEQEGPSQRSELHNAEYRRQMRMKMPYVNRRMRQARTLWESGLDTRRLAYLQLRGTSFPDTATENVFNEFTIHN